jgi:endonuclease/exonuclease/phosphatase (EEP) superfamily protein YafD
MVEEPKAFRGLDPYLKLRYPYVTPCRRDRCRAIIYSRLPPLAAEYRTLGKKWSANEDPNTHGRLGIATMQLRGPDGQPFTAIATHFSWPYPPLRAAHQRRVFIEHLAGIDRTRAVVGGDFNLTPWTYAMRDMDGQLGPLQRVTRALVSFPVPFASDELPAPVPFLPIDHVYVGNRWNVASVERGPYAGSDHYPVIVELVMPAGPPDG